MVITKLLKKTLVDIKKTLVQFIAVVVVSALGVMLLTGMGVVSGGLSEAVNEYYAESNLADMTAVFQGIDMDGIKKIEDFEGIEAVVPRLSVSADRKDADGSFLLKTIENAQRLNKIVLKDGVFPKGENECLISNSYALENNLMLEDAIKISVNDKTLSLKITGLAESAESAYLIKDASKSIVPDHKSYGLLFIDKSAVISIAGDEIYNELLIKMSDGASADDIGYDMKHKTDSAYGFVETVLKEDQSSYVKIQSDIDTVGSMSKILPYVFFLVAAVIIFISMSRMVQNERGQIGIMKALGVSKSVIRMHYIVYSVIECIIGGIIGNVVGILAIPGLFFDTYSSLYTLPEMKVMGWPAFALASVLFLLLFGIAACFVSIRKSLSIVPAECMRPSPPKKVKYGLIERVPGLWAKLPFRTKITLRNISMNKGRVLLSSIGVIGCVGLLLCGFGLREVTQNCIKSQFEEIQKYDLLVNFAAPFERGEKNYTDNSVKHVDEISLVGVTIQKNDGIRASLYVLNSNNESVRLISHDGGQILLPDDGIVVPHKLAEANGIKKGDKLEARVDSELYGNKSIDVMVASISDMYISQDIYASYTYIKQAGIDLYANGLCLTLNDAADRNVLADEIEENDWVHSVTIKAEMREQMEQLSESTDLIVYIMIFMSACLALAVIFNISSINIFERRRDIATLKVLGYFKNEINSLIYIENFIVTLLGILAGLMFGAFIFKEVLAATESKNMYFPFAVSAEMMILSVALTFLFAIVANLMLRRKIQNIDMIGSLKSIE
ncbi:MAG TPA: hypothetical protein DEQ02_10560 [Ruminococcaceae bacterium]|nr:hypothetical protein [Oscillospiraceae bacterium]